MKKILPILMLASASVAWAQSTNAVGTWKGSVVAPDDLKKAIAKEKDAEKKKMAQAIYDQAMTAKFELTLNKDKTFVATITQGGKSMKASGKWRQDKLKVYTTSTARDGKPVTGKEVQEKMWQMSKDGKGIIRPLGPDESPIPLAIFLKR